MMLHRPGLSRLLITLAALATACAEPHPAPHAADRPIRDLGAPSLADAGDAEVTPLAPSTPDPRPPQAPPGVEPEASGAISTPPRPGVADPDAALDEPWLQVTADGTAHNPTLYPAPEGVTAVRGTVAFHIQATHRTGVRGLAAWVDGVDAMVEGPAAGTSRATLALTVDTRTLHEGAHTLSVRVEDGVGQALVKILPFTVDRTPPALAVTLPALRQTAAGWHSPGTGPVEVDLQVDDATPYRVMATFVNGRALDQHFVAGPASVGFSLPAELLSEGSHTLRVQVEDALGQRTERDTTLWIDRTPPTVALPHTGCVDEGQLASDGDADFHDPLPLTPAGGTVRLWQTTWAGDPDRAGACALRFAVDDGDRAATAAVTLTVQGCLVDPQAADPHACLPDTERAWVLPGPPGLPGHRDLSMIAGADGLPFDPLDVRQTTHHLQITGIEAVDAAGHVTRLAARPHYRLEAVAPSLAVRFVAPQPDGDLRAPAVDLRDLGYADGGLATLFRQWAGALPELHTQRVVIDNPHGMAVQAELTLTDWRWQLATTLTRGLYGARPFQLALHDAPACAEEAERYLPIEGCAPAPGGLRCGACTEPGEAETVRVLDQPVGRAERAHLVGHGRDIRWQIQVPAGQQRVVDLSLLADLGAAHHPAHRVFEPQAPLPYNHAEVLSPLALAFDPDEGWVAGVLYEAVAEVALLPSANARVTVRSRLGDALSGPLATAQPLVIRHPNPTLDD